MKRTHLIAVVVGFVASVMLAQDAFGRARMYNPSSGRFMQRDPEGTPLAPPMPEVAQRSISPARFTQRDPHPDEQYTDGMNLYQYAKSDPVMLTDPSGLRIEITPELCQQWQKEGIDLCFKATKQCLVPIAGMMNVGVDAVAGCAVGYFISGPLGCAVGVCVLPAYADHLAKCMKLGRTCRDGVDFTYKKCMEIANGKK